MSAGADVAGRMPAHILCWVDGSDESCRAADWAARFAQRFGSQITYLALGKRYPHSEGMREFAKIEGVDLTATLNPEPDATACLGTAISIARKAGLDEVGDLVAEGPTHDAICRVADDLRADLVVIGNHRPSLVERLFGKDVGAGCSFAVLSVP